METTKKWNKMFLLGMTAMVLAFGLVLSGCPTDSGSDNDVDAFAGTWVKDNEKYIAGNGAWYYVSQVGGSSVEIIRGTYTVSGNSVVLKITHVNLLMFSGGADVWKSWAELTPAQKGQLTVDASDTFIGTIAGNQFIDDLGNQFTKQ